MKKTVGLLAFLLLFAGTAYASASNFGQLDNYGGYHLRTPCPNIVPEPVSSALFLLGSATLFCAGKFRKKK